MAYSTLWQFLEPQIGLQRIDESSTTQNHPLGTRRRAKDTGSNSNGEGDFVYAKGVAGTAVGSVVVYNEDDYSTVLLGPDMIGQVGISMSANVAGQFGWYQVRGKAVGRVLAGFVDNANVYATATPGSVDDAVVAGDRVKRCKGASAIDVPAVGMAELELDAPFVDDGTAA